MTPFELIFHHTPRTIAGPSGPDFESLTDHIQEMAHGQAKAQDICRELCIRTPGGKNPGLNLYKPEKISIGDYVLLRRDIVATNTINSVLKLTRIYTGKAYRVARFKGNHFSIEIGGKFRIYHRKRLRKVNPEA